MTRQEALAQMRYHWGDSYRFAVVDGRYTATAKFGQRDVLAANSPDALLAKIRQHYRPDLLEERCST